MEKIFAVIAAYNEQEHIKKVVEKTKKYVNEVIVVDDGSKDSTKELAKDAGATVLNHLVNLGKGAALKTGCDYALENGADLIITIDADMQHNPNDIPRFLDSLKECEVALSYRQYSKAMPLILKFGNRFINKTIKFLYGLEIKDSQCGYRAFTSNAYRKLRWKASDYSIESEMIAKIGKYKLSYTEIPIETVYSDKYKGTTIIDGIKIVLNLLFWRLNNL
ncbi:MAG: glycosyltransferase family 2 protein [Nanoarchaeota archaeon]